MRVQGLPSGANLADLKFERTFLFHSTIPVSDVPKRGVKLMERQSRSSSIFLYHSADSSESGVCVRGAQMHFNVGLHLRNLKDFRVSAVVQQAGMNLLNVAQYGRSRLLKILT